MSDPRTPEEHAQAHKTRQQAADGEDVVSTACPGCNTRFALLMRLGLAAKPLGTFSLSGTQMKVSARTAYLLRCTVCPWTGEGDPK